MSGLPDFSFPDETTSPKLDYLISKLLTPLPLHIDEVRNVHSFSFVRQRPRAEHHARGVGQASGAALAP